MNESQMYLYADFHRADDEALDEEALDTATQWDAVVDHAISIDYDVDFRC